MSNNAVSSEFPQKRRKQLTEMCTCAYAWVGVLLMHVHHLVHVCARICMRKRTYERVCGIPTAEQIRKVTPNSQSGAELSIKGNL